MRSLEEFKRGNIPPLEFNGAGGRLVNPTQEVEKTRLSRTIGPNDGMNDPFLNNQIHIPDSSQCPK
jgi:hypothetical protein